MKKKRFATLMRWPTTKTDESISKIMTSSFENVCYLINFDHETIYLFVKYLSIN